MRHGLTYRTLARGFIIACALTLANQSRAATISIYSTTPDGTPVVQVEGPMLPGDAQQFWAKVCNLSKAMISLKSPGGLTDVGLEIGEIIRRKNFDTITPNKASCSSSCALAWLGGVHRFMGQEAKIGFHASCIARLTEQKVFTCTPKGKDGKLEAAHEPGMASAQVASYVREMGLSEEAVLYMNQAPHESLTVLNAADAEEQGIAYTERDFPDENPNPALPKGGKARADFLKERATEFINSVFAAWSMPNEAALAALPRFYSKQVSYYGVLQEANAVLLDKVSSAERWPQREYKLKPNTFDATCDPGTLTCRVEGIVNWKVSNADRHASSAGATSFVFTLYSAGTTNYEPFIILLESSADWPLGDLPRYPQASCDATPLFAYPGAASSVSATEDPWVGQRGRAERAMPVATKAPEKRIPQSTPISDTLPRARPAASAAGVSVPVATWSNAADAVRDDASPESPGDFHW